MIALLADLAQCVGTIALTHYALPGSFRRTYGRWMR